MAKHTITDIDYDPKTGQFTTKPRKIGSIVGKDRCKFVRVYAGGKNHSAHRLAWFLMTGKWPPNDMVVDHINGDATDNRWLNLRLATPSQNQRNRTKPNKNKGDGLTGAYRDVRNGRRRWFSRIGDKHLGCFATKEEAHEAYRKAAIELYGEYAPGRLKHITGP